MGMGYCPTNDVCAGSSTNPATYSPPSGLGRSSTTNGMPASAAACIGAFERSIL